MVLMKLSTIVSKDFIFASVTISFTSFFLIHSFYLYPYRAALHKYFHLINLYMNEHCSSDFSIRILIPFCAVLFHPINTIQFAVADIWGTVSISILVFGFVNDITPPKAAKRYYVAIGILSQMGPIISGTIVSSLMSAGTGSNNTLQTFTEAYQFITLIGVSAMYLMMFVYFFVRFKLMKSENFGISEKRFKDMSNINQNQNKIKNKKYSFWETLKFTFSHKYILSVAGILCGYNMLNAILEHTWKECLHLLYHGCPNGYTQTRALLTAFTAMLTFFALMFGGHNALRIVGWKATALMCPCVLFCGSILFYLYGITHTQHSFDEQTLQFIPELPQCQIMVFVGALVLIFEKALKYSTCDPTKEIAYLYLESEQKYKGKIAVDLLGAKAGKVLGALFNIFLVSAINPRAFFVSSQYCALIGIVIGGLIWIASVSYLDGAIKRKQMDWLIDHIKWLNYIRKYIFV